MTETKQLWDAAIWVIVFLLSVVGFNLKRTVTKVDDHDKNHVPRKEFNDTIIALRKENKEDFNRVFDKIDDLPNKMRGK